MSTPINEALGKGEEVEFDGKQWFVEPLDFNDLGDLEREMLSEPPTESETKGEYSNPIERLNLIRLGHQHLIFWLLLRKADPELTPDERDNCLYRLTKIQAGKMIGADKAQDPDTLRFLAKVLQISGLLKTQGTLDVAPAKKKPVSRSRSNA